MRIYLNKEEIEKLKDWKDCPESLREKLGLSDVYLVSVYDTIARDQFYEIYDEPQRNINTGEILISGWLETIDDINRTALGLFSSLKLAIESLNEIKIKVVVFEGQRDHLIWRGQVLGMSEK